MPRLTVRRSAGTTWLWVALLTAMFMLVVAWFTDPLGYVEGTKPARNTASTEWTVAPDGPAVPVNLPQVRLKPTGDEPAAPASPPSQ
ncbi:MAG: hypothetical protein ACOY7L_10910 [Pseudomonadota bacterium]|nr:MAG: hypothetical protein ABT11_16485 [Novosphingobium sp. SCN 66-18]